MAKKDERGFASMDPDKQRRIASKGGQAAHEKGTAHEFSSEEARAAGRKGGQAVSRDRSHMAAIGRRGGQAVSRDRAHMAAIGREGGESHASRTDMGETYDYAAAAAGSDMGASAAAEF